MRRFVYYRVVRAYRRWVGLCHGGRCPPGVLDAMADLLAAVASDRTRPRVSRIRYVVRAFARAVPDGCAARLQRRHAHGSRRGGGMGGTGDVRIALRRLRSQPLLATVAVICLSIGIGANTLLFSAVDALLLRPLPVPEPDRLVRVFDPDARTTLRSSFTAEDLEILDREASAFEGILGVRGFRAVIELPGESTPVAGELVTPNFFQVVGVAPARGRGFRPDEAGPAAGGVAVLSHDLAARLLAHGVEPLGSELRVNARPVVVVGVASPPFSGTRFFSPADLWLPTGAGSIVDASGPDGRFEAMGRLRPGATPEAAAAELDGLLRSAGAGGAGRRAGTFVLPERAGLINPARPGLVAAASTAALGTALFILLVACGNVAGLVLAAAEARGAELGVRTALGATRTRLTAQLLIEAGVLAAPALAAGLWLAHVSEPVLSWLLPVLADRPIAFGLDARVLAYTAALAAVTLLLTGVAPALRVLRSPARLLGTRGSVGARRRPVLAVIVTAQVAVAALVLVVAGSFVRTLAFYESVDIGFEVEQRIALSLDASLSGMDPDEARPEAEQLARTGAELPGVRAATLAGGVTVGGSRMEVLVPGDEALSVPVNEVDGSYFRLLGIAPRAGDLSALAGEGSDPAVAIVNEELAERLWPNLPAVGRILRTVDGGELAVAAVVPTIRHGALAAPPRPLIYRPFGARRSSSSTLLLHVEGDPEPVVRAFRALAQASSPGIHVVEARTLEAIVDEDRLLARAAARLGIGAAAACLLLAAVGLLGALSHLVQRRRREIGVRIALGATPGAVVARVVGSTAVLLALGSLCGLLLGWAVAAALSGLLPGTRPFDLGVAGSALALVALASAAAVAGPGRRAARLDPAEILRRE